jgi:NifU-like protein
VKWLDRLLGSNPEPDAPVRGDPARVIAAQRVLDRMTPLIAADGGDVRLVAVEGDDVVLEWRGACKSCSAQADTLQGALEPELRNALPWLAHVRSTP